MLSKSDGLSAIAFGGFIDANKKQIIESTKSDGLCAIAYGGFIDANKKQIIESINSVLWILINTAMGLKSFVVLHFKEFDTTRKM